MLIAPIPLSRINAAPYNPRLDLKPGDRQYEQLRHSIEHFGCVEPLVWNKRTGNLVGGHQRFKVLQELGHTEVEVVIVDLPLEQEKLLNVALNKIAGDWDEPKLADLLQELAAIPDIDVGITGFDGEELDALLGRMLGGGAGGDDDEFDVEAALQPSQPAITQPGELLELGKHRLLCGDSTDPAQVQRLMMGARAMLFATDPPYLVNYDGTNHPGAKSRARAKDKNKDWSGTYGITWDDADANPDLYEKFVSVATAHAIHPRAAWYCWHASRRQAMVESVWEKHGAFVHQQIIWAKDRPILNRSWYTWQHEPCFFGWIKGSKPARRAKDYPSTVWQVPTVRAGERTEHPTSKPLELFRIPMQQHTQPGEICYEPFCGSGSQLIAAEQLGRRCFAIEISPHYCDVIVRRWIHTVGATRAPKALVERYRRTPEQASSSDVNTPEKVAGNVARDIPVDGPGEVPGVRRVVRVRRSEVAS